MLTLTLQIARFLFTTLAGGILLAAAGVLFLIGGFATMLSKPEVAARASLAELEARASLPPERYYELTGGHVVWPELRTLTVTRTKRGGEATSETAKMYYVPMVSKDAVMRFAKDGSKGLWSSGQVRAWLRISPEELEKWLPEVAAGVKDKQLKPEWLLKEHAVAVEARALSTEDQTARDGLAKASEGQPIDKTLVVRYDVKPPTKGALVGGGVCMMFLALLLAVPLAVVLVRRKQPARPAGRGGLEEAVRAGVEDGFRAALAPAGPERQFWYMRGNERHGPVPLSRLRALRQNGELASHDLVVAVGGQQWQRADAVAELRVV